MVAVGIELKHRFEGLCGGGPMLQTLLAQTELALRVDMVGLLVDYGGVTFSGFLNSSQFEFEIAAQDIKIARKFDGDGEHSERLLDPALRAPCQSGLERIVHCPSRSARALAGLLHGSDATAVRVAPFLVKVK